MNPKNDNKGQNFIEKISEIDALRFIENFDQIVASQNSVEFDFSMFSQKIDRGIADQKKYLKIYFLQDQQELFVGLSISDNNSFNIDPSDALFEVRNNNVFQSISDTNFNILQTNYINGFYPQTVVSPLNSNTTMVTYDLSKVKDYNDNQLIIFNPITLLFNFIKIDLLGNDGRFANLNLRTSLTVKPFQIRNTQNTNLIEYYNFGTVYP